MSYLSDRIMNTDPHDDILIYWAGGAGFVLKSGGITIGIDLYLSDSCRGADDAFKRIVPPPFEPDEIELDYLICTHEHGDHLDTVSLKKFIRANTATKLIGPGASLKLAKENGVDESRLIRLDREDRIKLEGVDINAVFADHGEQSPDAIGAVIFMNGKRIYFTGDTCYRVDFPDLVKFDGKVDLLIVPINGKYGNPDPKDAAYFTAWVKPEIVIPCHYWLFKEHGGDPGAFVKCCGEIAGNVCVKVLAIGEEFRI